MNVLMIDIDSKIGNVYLMQLSAYHKARGDNVSMVENGEPDKVYVSCLFTKNRGKALDTAKRFECPVVLGGTGFNLEPGDTNIMKLKPDYDLYPSKEALGRTTLGCIRKCPWCVVPQKEGEFRSLGHIKDFYDDRFATVHLLDNNILADPALFFVNTDWLIDHSLKLKEEGMDIRLLTPRIASQLRRLRMEGLLHFAWDEPRYREKVLNGIRSLKEVGFNTRHEVSVYVLTQYDTTPQEDLDRVLTLKGLDVNPFVMVYGKPDKWHRKLQRFVGRRAIFWSKSDWIDELRTEMEEGVRVAERRLADMEFEIVRIKKLRKMMYLKFVGPAPQSEQS